MKLREKNFMTPSIILGKNSSINLLNQNTNSKSQDSHKNMIQEPDDQRHNCNIDEVDENMQDDILKRSANHMSMQSFQESLNTHQS